MKRLKFDPIPYLLSSRHPSWIKYQTFVRILGRPELDSEVGRWRDKRDSSAIVARIREKQALDGSFSCLPWMHIHKYYFHQMLAMGYGLEDATVKRAAQNLLNYQLPDGAYMHPKGRKVNVPNSNIGWAACITGYVTHALIHLGLQKDPRVETSLNVMLNKQRKNGGWICDTVGQDCPYCIKSGVPWVFRCLAEARLIDKKSPVAKRVLSLISRHKKKIISHGYQKDHYYRCDEALLLPGLYAVGLTDNHHLVRELRQSLIDKQQPDGSWRFRGKSSPWYTIEVLAALGYEPF